MAEPPKASFDNLSLDTLIHPDNYTKSVPDSELPNFEGFVNKIEGKKFEPVRKVKMEPVGEEENEWREGLEDLDD